ncbi:LOW QUALITY PROTEIN: guanine nucleotide exchange protein smcr8a [Gadus morhua]|uniref:LOW QUALITY PROTEIN: guanine nucleotide exchange protein smcr8a n=1 Tax=Gadus morhua TaxID=8049 RepID=UPI0011B5168D|nr:LOW QUALITY PROTEIN: guanine nucleotide exchange protein smcr8a-like [Gadus morhua]
MIGSPDVVALTREDENGEANADPLALPDEFSVPLYPHANSNPWAKTSYAKFTKDFILISEFSEQVGPQPLLTIPDDPTVCGTFDLNYFSLRIMSVDYQASFVGHPPGSGYPRLSFVEDSRVVLGDSKEGAFAYVHHLTLYDLEARGFVRPFCMAYVSADERKIMMQFEELSQRFSQASECLKTGNRRAFAKELQRKLQDLEYTRLVLRKEEGLQREAAPPGIYSSQVVEKANELANVEKSIYEHRDLLRQISSYPGRPRRDPQAAPCPRCLTEGTRGYEDLLEKYATLDHALRPDGPGAAGRNGEGPGEGPGEEGVGRRASYTPQLIKAKSPKCFDKRLKTLSELSESRFHAATLDLLRGTERLFSGDLCYQYSRRLDRALRRKQQATNFLFEEDPGEDVGGDGVTARPACALSHAGDGPWPPRPPPIVLCPLALELDALRPPGPLDPAAGGGPLRPGRSRPESSPSDRTPETSEDTKCSFSSERSAEGPGRPPDRDRSPASARSDPADPDLLFDPDLTPERQSTSEGTETTGGEDEAENGGDRTPASPQGAPALQTDLEAALGQMDAACCMAQDAFLYEGSLGDAASDAGLDGPPATVVSQEPQASPALQGAYAVGPPQAEPPAVGLGGGAADDGSDRTVSASAGSDRAGSPPCYGGGVTLRQRKRAGQGALRFVRQYPFALQALWCLLSGRTLVVLGSDEARVRRMVSALALFVPGPGPRGERVQAWLSCTPSLADLHRWKLIGLQRLASPLGSSGLHSLTRYSRYLSVLDADQKTLRCPPYRGTLLANMADHRTSLRRGSTYFLHVQSALGGLASKAFLLAFTHHLHLPVGPGEGPEAVEARRRGFLQEQLGLGPQDGQVLLYLSGLVTQHYLGPPPDAAPPAFSFGYTASLLYKI